MRPQAIILGIILPLCGFVWWQSAGANTGWTKTSVAVPRIDPITEIAYTDYEDRFVPGIEFPVGFAVIGGLVLTIAWWSGRRSRQRRK